MHILWSRKPLNEAKLLFTAGYQSSVKIGGKVQGFKESLFIFGYFIYNYLKYQTECRSLAKHWSCSGIKAARILAPLFLFFLKTVSLKIGWTKRISSRGPETCCKQILFKNVFVTWFFNDCSNIFLERARWFIGMHQEACALKDKPLVDRACVKCCQGLHSADDCLRVF